MAQDIRTIAELKRLQNSVNGNPRFLVRFTDGTRANTKGDSSLGYVIDNPEYRGPCEITIDGRGRIVDMTPVGGES